MADERDGYALLTKPGCHLCDDARAVIIRVAADVGVPWDERDITQSEQDIAEYWDEISGDHGGRRHPRLLAGQ